MVLFRIRAHLPALFQQALNLGLVKLLLLRPEFKGRSHAVVDPICGRSFRRAEFHTDNDGDAGNRILEFPWPVKHSEGTKWKPGACGDMIIRCAIQAHNK